MSASSSSVKKNFASKPQRILLVTPVWKGSLGFFVERALQQLGHETHVYDYRIVAYGSNKYRQTKAGPLRILRNRVGIQWMNYHLRRFMKHYAPDIVLILKGELVEESTVRHLVEESGAAVALWYPDPSRELLDRSERRILASMRWCDVSFVCDPTHVPDSLLPQIRRMEYLTFACDPEFHHPVTVSEEDRARFGGAACFVGNWQGVESPRYALLQHLAGYPINVWGNGWQASDLAGRGLRVMNQSVYGDDMLKVYSSNGIALNFNFDDYLNLRNFEVPACGPLLITTAVPYLDEYFRLDEEIVTFATPEELRDKVGYYLAHPDIAAQIAKRGQARAHREHTFQQRMVELLDKLGRA